MHARLNIETGDGAPPVYDLVEGSPITLGRHRDNAIVLRDEHASRWHAELAFRDGRWLLSNIGDPINGTLLDGRRLTIPAPLANGQEIRIGGTRLRFTLAPAAEPEIDAANEPITVFLVDELTALCNFMAGSVASDDPRLLVRRALETALAQTRATVVGFLSLDPDGPVPKLIVPEQAAVDVPLSRELTRRVQQTGRSVWLKGGASPENPSDSVASFADALCVLLQADGAPLGALHVYKADVPFTDRQRRFCEVLAGYLANHLHVVRARRSLEADNARLRSHSPAADRLLGSSPAMQQLRRTIERAAARPATVLIRGESGVGKELVALALHRQSSGRDGPLVVVNCAAIAATLPEAELFGHRKGAFTGADRDRPGFFQQADEGTLFLDEIGELPLDCQGKLLRVIEGHGFRPVGATADVRVDVRILAATNRSLEQEVKTGRFRQDLFFRLQVIPIRVPPLREHIEDLPELAAFYLEKLARECRRQVRLTDAALARLQTYSWPGNVRQLGAVLESAVTMTDGPVLDAADLPLPPDTLGPAAPSLRLDELETWAIRQALRRTGGNITQAAKLLGVVRDTLTNKMKKKGIERK